MTTNARDEKWSSWIDWSGGECPLPEGENCCVKYRNGQVRDNVPAKTDGGLVSAGGFDTTDEYWESDGKGMDIIAYRYKIKEPESDMHPDLEWLARNVSEWRYKMMTHIEKDDKYPAGHCYSQTQDVNTFTHAQWLQARKDLGIIMSDAEEEMDVPEWTGSVPVGVETEASRSDGSTASYYRLPEGCTQLQHLISHRNMNAQVGEIFRACYRYGMASHSDQMRDARKVLFYAMAEVERLEALGAGSE